jgi:hypothetical protein
MEGKGQSVPQILLLNPKWFKNRVFSRKSRGCHWIRGRVEVEPRAFDPYAGLVHKATSHWWADDYCLWFHVKPNPRLASKALSS